MVSGVDNVHVDGYDRWAPGRTPGIFLAPFKRRDIELINTLRRPRFYYGWWIVFAVVLAGIVQSSQGHPALGVFMTPMTEHFEWSKGAYTSGMTIGSMLGGFIAIGVGPLVDRYGGRWILTIAAVVVGGTVILTAFVTAFWQFFALQIIARAVNMGVIVLVMQVVIPKWFVRKRGRAVAFGGIGSMAGNAGVPLFVQFFITKFGWRVAAFALGIGVWLVALPPIWFFLRRSPEDLGLRPDGDPAVDQGGSEGLNEHSVRAETSFTLREVVRHRSFYFLVTAFTLSAVVGSSVNLHVIPYFFDRGLNPGVAVIVWAVFSSIGGVGALATGFIVERYPARYVLSLIFFLGACCYIILLNVNGPVTALVWACSSGIVRGGMHTLTQVIFADYYGRGSLGSIRGITSPTQMGANSLGPLAAALAFDFRGDYEFIFILFGVLMVAASFFIFLARPPASPIIGTASVSEKANV